MLSLLNDDKLRRVLARLLDPAEFLADHGIRFTILAPGQCARVRPLVSKGVSTDEDPDAEPAWTETNGETLDTRHPYLVRLKTGREIAIFFYDGARSRAVAFEGILNSGEQFATRLIGGFTSDAKPQILHVAMAPAASPLR